MTRIATRMKTDEDRCKDRDEAEDRRRKGRWMHCGAIWWRSSISRVRDMTLRRV
jgi:hypothetical protein